MGIFYTFYHSCCTCKKGISRNCGHHSWILDYDPCTGAPCCFPDFVALVFRWTNLADNSYSDLVSRKKEQPQRVLANGHICGVVPDCQHDSHRRYMVALVAG